MTEHATPLLAAVPPPPLQAADPQLRALLSSGKRFHTFKQWCTPYDEGRLATLTQLRHTLDQLLPVLTGARDFAGAAKVLSVIYHRFSLAPALCVQTSLEILRRQQPEHRDDLLQFYLAAVQEDRLDKRLLLKELWMFYVLQGDFYEAYHLYKDDLQSLEGPEDPRLIANFGILCYWLLFIESSELRGKLKRDDDDDDGDNVDDVAGHGNAEPDSSDDARSNDDDDFVSDADTRKLRRERKRKRSAAAAFNQWYQTTDTPLSVDAVIESRYLFKTAIGVHILYQEAARALRRAVSLCPTSAHFTEFYAQLLTLVGEVDTACDYVENLYHLNPADPHAARMLAGFLEAYYPNSGDAQINVYLRWLKNDPASAFALEKLMDLASAGAIASIKLVRALAEAIDVCGGNVYLLPRRPLGAATKMTTSTPVAPPAAALWRHLAQLLVAMRDEPAATREQLREVATTRAWWQRVYFTQPRTREDVVVLLQRHGDDASKVGDTLVHRAVVAYELFGASAPIVYAVCEALARDDDGVDTVSVSLEHSRLFESLFTPEDIDCIWSTPELLAPPQSLRNAPFRHVVHHHLHPASDNAVNADAPEDRPRVLPAVRVMARADVVVDTDGARPHAHVRVTTTSVAQQVDRELVAALEAAVRDDSFAREMVTLHDTTRSIGAGADAVAGAASRGAGITVTTRAIAPPARADANGDVEADLALPMYVQLVEEVSYKDREAPINHVYTFVVESLRRLASLNVRVPTLLEVETAHRLFLARWARNEFAYGHRGLLLRYETRLAKIVQPLVHAHVRRRNSSSNSSTSGSWDPPPLVVTRAMVDDACAQLHAQVPAAHMHFPSRHDVEIVLRIKARALLRLRRQVLRAYRRSMRGVLRQLVFLETRALAELALDVCARNGMAGVVSIEDLEDAAIAAQLRMYWEVVLTMPLTHRVLVRGVVDAADRMRTSSGTNNSVTPEALRRDCSDVVPALVAQLKATFPSHTPSRRRLRACVWMRRHEHVYGPFDDFWECAPADASAEATATTTAPREASQ